MTMKRRPKLKAPNNQIASDTSTATEPRGEQSREKLKLSILLAETPAQAIDRDWEKMTPVGQEYQ
jgi:hypothetical protein